MRVIVEQSLPTTLSELRKFIDKATQLVEGDMTARVSEQDGWLRICAVRDLEQVPF